MKKTENPGNETAYTFANGKMFHGYKIYKNGDINMMQFVPASLRLIDDEQGILLLENFFSKFILDQMTKLAEHRREFWRDVASELKLIDKTYDENKFSISFDTNTGLITKTKWPETTEKDAVASVAGKGGL